MRLHSVVFLTVLFATVTLHAADKGAKGALAIEGKVVIEKKDVDNFTSIKIKTDKGDLYSVTLDELGKQVGVRYDGIRVYVRGKVATKGDEKWVTVTQIGEGKTAQKK